MPCLVGFEGMMQESTTFPHIIQGGGVELVIQAMQMIRQFNYAHGGGLLQSVTETLEHLFQGSIDARKTVIEGDAIPLLLNLLQNTTAPLAIYNRCFYQVKICTILNYLPLENSDSAVGL